MSRDDWFRHTAWNDKIAAQFEAKLKRARRKDQYLRIQAPRWRAPTRRWLYKAPFLIAQPEG